MSEGIVKQQEQHLSIPQTTSIGLETWKKLSEEVRANGVNALELIDSEPLDAGDLTKAQIALEANFGTTYSTEKMLQLFLQLQKDGWTKERFVRTLDWFIKNKHFPAWTIADWYEFGVKVYPYAWAQEKMINSGWSRDSFDYYQLPNGDIVCKPKDGVDLPFPPPPAPKRIASQTKCSLCGWEVSWFDDFWKEHNCEEAKRLDEVYKDKTPKEIVQEILSDLSKGFKA